MSVLTNKPEPKTTLAPKRDPKTRRRLGGMATLMDVDNTDPAFHYAWINEDKVSAAEDSWYEFVTHTVKVGGKRLDASLQPGGKISMKVNKIGTIAYLMRIPLEYYEEDMALEQSEKVDAKERQLMVDLNNNGLQGTISLNK